MVFRLLYTRFLPPTTTRTAEPFCSLLHGLFCFSFPILFPKIVFCLRTAVVPTAWQYFNFIHLHIEKSNNVTIKKHFCLNKFIIHFFWPNKNCLNKRKWSLTEKFSWLYLKDHSSERNKNKTNEEWDCKTSYSILWC